jgi:aminoglycoside phosphotransferase family enzyme
VAEPFLTLFREFLDAYTDEARDGELLEVIPPFLAFRALVIGHPRWYPALAPATRRALLAFARALMAGGPLKLEQVPDLLEAVA